MSAGPRFRLVLVGMVVAVAGVYASVLLTRSSEKPAPAGHAKILPPKRWALDPSTWGTVKMTGSEPCLVSSPCLLRIVLGPRVDRTWLYTLQTPWKGTIVTLEDHQPFNVADHLRYAAARCGLHVTGYGLDAQMLSGIHCIPAAARGESFRLRIANLLPQPRAVVLRYYHD